MALIIVLLHIGSFLFIKDYPFQSGYLAVEVFLVLSGFLLAKTYDKLTQVAPNQQNSILLCKSYFYRRFVRLWPEYFFAILLAILLLGLFARLNIQPFFLNVFMSGGWGGIPMIVRAWYIPVVLWCGCLLFNLLVLGKEKSKTIILPLIGLLCLFYLINSNLGLKGTIETLPSIKLSEGTIRGLLGMIVGIYTYWGCQILKSYKAKWRLQFITVVLFIGEIISVAGLGYVLIFQEKYNVSLFNVYFYASFLIGLLYFQKEKLLKFLSWKIWIPFTNVSYSLYITHAIVREIVKEHYLFWVQSHVIPGTIIIVLSSIMLAFFNYYGAKYFIITLKKIAFKK